MTSSLNRGYNNYVMERPASENATLVERLLSFSLPDGGMPYYRGGESSAEPTFLAALALLTAGIPPERAKPLLAWRGLQNPDGFGRDRSPVSGPGAVAHRAGRDRVSPFRPRREPPRPRFPPGDEIRDTLANNPRLKQDNTLAGWPWVRGTFGWVEPTAWAVLALVLSGNGAHPRAIEGARFLWDREIASGGWNYGSPELDDTELLPFWDTTGLALVALTRGGTRRTRDGLDIIEKQREKIESLRGLSWAVLALDSYGRDARAMRAKLREVMASAADDDATPGISPWARSPSPGRRFSSHEAAAISSGTRVLAAVAVLAEVVRGCGRRPAR